MISRFLPPPVRRLLGVKVASRPPSYLLLDQPGSLGPLLQALGPVREVTLDTEADNMYHYKTRVCLFQLLVADEIFLVGTGAQVSPVIEVDHRSVGTGKIGELTKRIQSRYFDAVRGKVPAYKHWLTPIY